LNDTAFNKKMVGEFVFLVCFSFCLYPIP